MANLNDYRWIYFGAHGNYVYSASQRKLTLNAQKIDVTGHQTNWLENFEKNENMKKALDSLKTIEISDYFWASKTFIFPIIEIKKAESGEPEDYIWDEPFITWTPIKANNSYYNLKSIFNLIKVVVNAKKSEKPFENDLKTHCRYQDLLLNPDKTFTITSTNSSYDRDGPYNWDSSFSCEGKWNYNSESRLMKLTLGDYHINNDGKKHTEAASIQTIETNNFYFEGKYINSLEAHWNYDTFSGVKDVLVKREKQRCHLCGKNYYFLEASKYHSNDLALCKACDNFIKNGKEKLNIHVHPLVFNHNASRRCDICKTQSTRMFWQCTSCGYDACLNCFLYLETNS